MCGEARYHRLVAAVSRATSGGKGGPTASQVFVVASVTVPVHVSVRCF